MADKRKYAEPASDIYRIWYGQQRRKERKVNQAFSASDLFVNNDTGFIYNISDINTLFQDSAGIVPVTANGQIVRKVLDTSGNNNHLTQANPSFAFTYNTDGVLHWLSMNGTNNRMSAVFARPLRNIVCIAQAFKSDLTSARYLFDGISDVAADRFSYWGISSPSLIEIGVAGSLKSASSVRTTNTIVTQAIARSNAMVTHRLNGIGTSFGTVSGAAGMSGITIGSRFSQDSGFFQGRLYAMVGIGRETDMVERANLDAWLAELSGVSL